MLLARNPQIARRVFIFCNVVFITVMYQRIEDPYQFCLMGGGLFVFSFFLVRAIKQWVGE